MVEKRKEIKKEIYRNIRSILILLISIVLIYFNFSIAKYLDFTTDKKIIWALDFGLYNSLTSIIFSLITYFIKVKKLFIKVELINKKEENNEITLNNEPEKICLKIKMEGIYKKIPSKLEIKFPHWIDVQISAKPYIVFNEEKNFCLIDLDYFISNKSNIYTKKSITFDIICNDDEKAEDLVDSKLKIGPIKSLFQIHFENAGLKMKRK